MYERIWSVFITTFMVSVILIVGSIGCCSRQHLDIKFASLTKDCKSLDSIEKFFNKYIETMDNVVRSNDEIVHELKLISEKYLGKKTKEFNVIPTSLTLKIGNKKCKDGCFTAISGDTIYSVISSNEMVAKSLFDYHKKKL
ncbi:poly-beta-hydroxyalkanoate depolymerase [Candidatus Scalindua japonica]|uniref:Poly-beta-hydroxyalkanoate depolymerase n=1 Tax=Candidatus Scalindua japonica TaxID=1284222 RepID=A0A286TU14_9BACT|nr:hypothetical protein [Candidatus Scalindua japonica]GAX59341.1 poly-beta-hydroxyalkanoate depolymerase [Candidatus Scalindua japonica]